jgi:hypothetical protein
VGSCFLNDLLKPLAPFSQNKAKRLIMIKYRYDFDLHTLQELPSNDARLFLDIIVNKALLKAQAIQYRENTVFVISEEQYKKLINS